VRKFAIANVAESSLCDFVLGRVERPNAPPEPPRSEASACWSWLATLKRSARDYSPIVLRIGSSIANDSRLWCGSICAA
jgi:hypothetical protein